MKAMCLGALFSSSSHFIVLFCVPMGMFFTFLTSIFKQKTNFIIAVIIISVLSFLCMAQAVYYNVFKAFFVLDIITLAFSAFSTYESEIFISIFNMLPTILLLFVPLIVLLIFGTKQKDKQLFDKIMQDDVAMRGEAENLSENSGFKRELRLFFKPRNGENLFNRCGKTYCTVILSLAILTQILSVIIVLGSTGGILSASALYTTSFTPNMSVLNFGLFTTTRLETQRLIAPNYYANMENNAHAIPVLGTVQEENDETHQQQESEQTATQVPSENFDANILEIDFSSLIAQENVSEIQQMHEYFSQREPTYQNEYTGMFEGKNLIFITAEGFWEYAVNEQYTPTLYKLANEGFVFENFYNPLWWKSTIDGEFAICTGLIPSDSVKSFELSGANAMPFAMGNALGSEGYETTAYHNHTYDYYARDISHPNLGYEYYGIGNGLVVQETWPASDLEMMQQTIGDALSGNLPFHNYYMTISGHLYYTYDGNFIAAKNKDLVENMGMSDEAEAYMATQIELDKALEYTLEQLEKAGELENTVICISADHYPYGLSEQTMSEFYGAPIDMNFEVYRSPLIIWSGDMEEPVVIDKLCSSIDILPTLLNLFGIDYDSRLLMGSDILSNSQGIAVFSTGSFITEQGTYNAYNDDWLASEDTEVTADYVLNTFNSVQDMFNYSHLIIKNDYYNILGLEGVQ